MAADEPRPWLDDILDAIDWIERITAGKPFAGYRADHPMRDAVERDVERLSEASRRLPDDLKGRHPTLPWRQIAQVGNILRHGYRRVDHAMVWEIVELDLPPLRSAVEQILADLANECP